MRDVLYIPFNADETIVVASDNSGAIGLKADDVVEASYEMVAYYSFRVAVMECIGARGEPFAITLQNFCGDEAWANLRAGIVKGLAELGLNHIPLTGSTESNFSLQQSAIGLTVLGKKEERNVGGQLFYSKELSIAVIGLPLVGNAVVEFEKEVAPLALFKQLASMEQVVTLPVGSKGILHELNTLFRNRTFQIEELDSEVDLSCSSGPATCFLAVYPSDKESEIANVSGRYFKKITEKN